jgi:hypothetical protein
MRQVAVAANRGSLIDHNPAEVPDEQAGADSSRMRYANPHFSSLFCGFQWREGLSVGIEGFVISLDPTGKAARDDRV